jgi:hypothetical protein
VKLAALSNLACMCGESEMASADESGMVIINTKIEMWRMARHQYRQSCVKAHVENGVENEIEADLAKKYRKRHGGVAMAMAASAWHGGSLIEIIGAWHHVRNHAWRREISSWRHQSISESYQ